VFEQPFKNIDDILHKDAGAGYSRGDKKSDERIKDIISELRKLL